MKKNRVLILSAIIILNLLILIFYGCRPSDIKDNKLYVVEQNNNQKKKEAEERLDEMKSFNMQLETKGIDPFIQEERKQDIYKNFYANIGDMGLNENRVIPLTISKDANTLFAMELIVDGLTDIGRWQLSSTNEGLIIKGESEKKINLFKVNLNKKEMKSISQNIDFISLVKWNDTENKVAFLSGKQIIVYDLDQQKLLFKDSKRDHIIYFSWSHDGEKIYTESTNLVNDSIYYTDSEKLVNAYETKEGLYYKGQLDKNYYFAILREIDELKLKNGGVPKYTTTIVDKEGNMIKELSGGRFRGAYKRSVLQVGQLKFGLYYYPDIEKMDDVKVLTEEYVYDSKFVIDGKIAYIVEDRESIDKNGFILHIADKEGNEVNRYNISSSKVFITPDGKTGIFSADYYYEIDFKECEIVDIEIKKKI